jgi:hypothetical protein
MKQIKKELNIKEGLVEVNCKDFLLAKKQEDFQIVARGVNIPNCSKAVIVLDIESNTGEVILYLN